MKKILGKAMKVVLYIAVLATFLASLGYLYLRSEFGRAPTAEEKAAYAELGYYYDGRFHSTREVIFQFDKVSGSGSHNPLRFLTRSINAPKEPLPKVSLDHSSFPVSPADYALYWLGHSTAILELGGKRLLFDPVFDNAAPIPFAVPRYDSPVLAREELPPVDYILITHNHYDHLEKKTVRSIQSGRFIVPLGVGAALRGWGIDAARITELGWGESFSEDGLTLTAEEGVHFSGRSLSDRNKTLWVSYVIKSAGKNIFWSGDTGYGQHFSRIREKHGPFDLAAIEIDGWNTGWPSTHLFPQEAVQAALDLGAAQILPVHWGVFDLAMHQ